MRFYRICLRVNGDVREFEQAGHDLMEAMQLAFMACTLNVQPPPTLELAAVPVPLDTPKALSTEQWIDRVRRELGKESPSA